MQPEGGAGGEEGADQEEVETLRVGEGGGGVVRHSAEVKGGLEIPLLWIRFRIDLAVLDPDPCWVCGSRSIEIDQNLTNKPGFLSFMKACVPSFGPYVFYLLLVTYFWYIFHVKIHVTLRHARIRSGSALVLLPGS